MPKTMNIKKAASALNQNQKQIKAALAGVQMTFAAVEKNLGRAQFLLKLTDHKTATGAPRGLFTAGTMRISVGQIVIVEGNPKIGLEIVARIDDLSDAQKLVKSGLMPADVLAQAAACGSVSGVKEEEDDDLFERPEETEGASFEPSLKGGVKGARKQQESLAAAAALARNLGSQKAKVNLPQLGAADEVFVPEAEAKVKKAKKVSAPVSGATVNGATVIGLAALSAVAEDDEEIVLWDSAPEDEVNYALAFKPKAVLPKITTSWEEDADGEINIDAI
jgi:translation initiation factor IF-1